MSARSFFALVLLSAPVPACALAVSLQVSIVCSGNIDAAIDSALSNLYSSGGDSLDIELTTGSSLCSVSHAHSITGAVSVTIDGPGTDVALFMSGDSVARFQVSDGAQFNIGNITLESAPHTAISVADATLDVDNVVFDNNVTGASGGAISATNSTVTVKHSVLSSNSAAIYGAAIATAGVSGSLTVSDSKFVNNQVRDAQTGQGTAGIGGGIFAGGVPVTLNRVLFDSNKSANTDGGAVHVENGALTVRNSTFNANVASHFGGAIHFDGYGVHPILLNNVTLRGDVASSGSELYLSGAGAPSLVTITNSLISGTCEGFAGSPNAHNSIESPGNTCLFPSVTNSISIPDADLHLSDLSDNGGLTSTFFPQTFSVLINAGGDDCENVDQRNFRRNVGACDVGAVEAGATDVIFADGFGN